MRKGSLTRPKGKECPDNLDPYQINWQQKIRDALIEQLEIEGYHMHPDRHTTVPIKDRSDYNARKKKRKTETV